MVLDTFPDYRLPRDSLDSYLKRVFTGMPIKVEASSLFVATVRDSFLDLHVPNTEAHC